MAFMGGGQIVRAAAQRAQQGRGRPQRGPVQRFLNKASGKMETPQQMRNYRAPQPQQQRSQRSSQQTRTVTTTSRPAQAPSLIQMSPAQIEDRAKRIVNSELAAERLPFQQRSAQIPGEEQAAQTAHAQAYSQLDAGTAAQQASQAASAKTFQNVAADAVKRASEAPTSAAPTAEHLGGTVSASSALSQQQQAAKTLLEGIAAASQAGTNARQQSESNFLASTRVNDAAQGAAGTGKIQGEYAKAKQTNADEEARTTATKPGRVGKLALSLFGEQEKLKLAAAGLNIKDAEAERHREETTSNIKKARGGEKVAGAKLRNEGGRLKLAQRKQGADEAYKNASLGQKRTKDALDIKQKEIAIKKSLETHPGSKGLTKDQQLALSGEAAKVFSIFKRGREEGASPAAVRAAITAGYIRREPSKAEIKQIEAKGGKPWHAFNEKTGLALKQPIWLDVAEQIMQKEYVGAQTKQQLREMGLPDSEWSNHFLGKRPTAIEQTHSRTRQKRGY